MRFATIFGTLATSVFLISSVNAHGYVQHLSIGGQKYIGFRPDENSAKDEVVPGIGDIKDIGTPQRPSDNVGQGPSNVPPSSLTGLLATGGRKAMPQEIKQITAPAKAGDLVKLFFINWPTGHYGVSWNMMASCEGSCDGKKGEDLLWFKISEETYDSETKMWPMAIPKTGPLGITRQFTLPTNLKGGEYLLSTTLLSLHGTELASGQAAPQYYPTAWQIKLDSSGKTDPSPKMKIPDMYTQLPNNATTFNIWHDDHTAFVNPGVPVYKGSDSVAGDPKGFFTDDVIACNCDGSGGASPPVAPPTATSSPAASPPAAPSVAPTGAAGKNTANVIAPGSQQPPQDTPPSGGSAGDCSAAFAKCQKDNVGKDIELQKCNTDHQDCMNVVQSGKRSRMVSRRRPRG